MIKPDAMKNGHAGAIINHIIQNGFRVVALKMTSLTAERAGQFYEVHKERPFYQELVDFMSSGPIIAAILEKDNAVADFRKVIGATAHLKQMKVPSVNYMQLQWAKMLFMEVTVMKMQKLKAISFSAGWSNSDIKRIDIKKAGVKTGYFLNFFGS